MCSDWDSPRCFSSVRARICSPVPQIAGVLRQWAWKPIRSRTRTLRAVHQRLTFSNVRSFEDTEVAFAWLPVQRIDAPPKKKTRVHLFCATCIDVDILVSTFRSIRDSYGERRQARVASLKWNRFFLLREYEFDLFTPHLCVEWLQFAIPAALLCALTAKVNTT